MFVNLEIRGTEDFIFFREVMRARKIQESHFPHFTQHNYFII